MKLSVNVTGSPGPDGAIASCRAEVEIDNLDADAESRLYQAVRRCMQVAGRYSPNPRIEAASSVRRQTPGGTPPQSRSFRTATQKQVTAIKAIARRKGINLFELLRDRYAVNDPAELSLGNASSLIGELKSSEIPAESC